MKALVINFLRNNKTAQIFFAYVGLILLCALLGKIFPTFAGTILCLLLIGGYYGILFRCLKFCDINFFDELIKDLPRILLAGAVGTGFIIIAINLHQTIYTGDSLETWEPTVYCVETAFSEPWQALKNLRGSINYSDYNDFLPMLMALPMHLFGKSFLCYALYVWLMFGLPGIFFAAATFKTIFEKAGFKISCGVLMAILMLLPAMETPIFIGYANISILLPGSIILAMLLSLNRAELQLERLVFIAVLCIFAVFQARTAVYMLIGMFFGYSLYVIISSLQERSFELDFFLLIKKFLCIGALGLIIASPLFFTFIKHALTYDIGTAYSAYQRGMDFSERQIQHVYYLGAIMYMLLISGVIVSLCNKKLLPYVVMFAMWFFTAELLICRVQLIDRQHNYTMILPFAFIIAALIYFAWSKKKSLGAALIFILTFNFCQAYSPTLNIPTYFNSGYLIPVRHDIDDLKKFVDEMNELTAANDRKILDLLHSGLYNSHTLTKIYFPENHNALQSLVGTGDVDLRDGFQLTVFEADYVIIPEPMQLHLRPEDESTIVKPYEWISKPSPLSHHYKQIREYTFYPDGISAVQFKIYEKISPYEKANIDFVEKYFDERYPNHPELFKERFEKYKREHFKE